MRLFITSAALIVGLFGAGSSTAFAAKGVKKTATPGVAHGVVTHVEHHKVKGPNGHIGEITIKTHHSKKKGQPAVAGKKVSGHTHKFTIGANTTFSHSNGKQQTPATFAAVHQGEHVAITHTGHHASSVKIHTHAAKKANPKKANKKKAQ